jgi:hypothetical protein
MELLEAQEPKLGRPDANGQRPRLIATRYWVGILLAAAIAISYLDRQALPIAIKSITQDIPISETELPGSTPRFFLLMHRCIWAAAS